MDGPTRRPGDSPQQTAEAKMIARAKSTQIGRDDPPPAPPADDEKKPAPPPWRDNQGKAITVGPVV